MNAPIKAQWTQQEAIDFECARECITHLIAIHSGEIDGEERKPQPDASRIASLLAESRRLAQERNTLHVGDLARVARIRAEYGAAVRAWRAGQQMNAA